jgi:hypothetical protein
MSFFGNFGQPQSKKGSIIINRHTDLILTTKGEDRMSKLEPTAFEWKIFSTIKQAGPAGCTIEEIGRKEQIPLHKLEPAVIEYMRNNLVMEKE